MQKLLKLFVLIVRCLPEDGLGIGAAPVDFLGAGTGAELEAYGFGASNFSGRGTPLVMEGLESSTLIPETSVT